MTKTSHKIDMCDTIFPARDRKTKKTEVEPPTEQNIEPQVNRENSEHSARQGCLQRARDAIIKCAMMTWHISAS